VTDVACIGECMIELREQSDGLLSRSFGGDTLNTAVYLARLGVGVDYVTALGTDPFSDEMLEAWRAEGVGTKSVLRVSVDCPGSISSRPMSLENADFHIGVSLRRSESLSSFPASPALRKRSITIA
jgi:2-dehydro-3-deoxygluconokinase